MIVAGGRHHRSQQRPVTVDAADNGGAEQQELQVVVGCLARIKQVALGRVADRPVDVLTGAIDAREGLLVQQASETVLFSRALEHGHGELLVVGGDVGRLEVGRDLKLARRHLVVARLGGHA